VSRIVTQVTDALLSLGHEFVYIPKEQAEINAIKCGFDFIQ
jgi:hypothetical protein